jgi:hypothetical protein
MFGITLGGRFHRYGDTEREVTDKLFNGLVEVNPEIRTMEANAWSSMDRGYSSHGALQTLQTNNIRYTVTYKTHRPGKQLRPSCYITN